MGKSYLFASFVFSKIRFALSFGALSVLVACSAQDEAARLAAANQLLASFQGEPVSTAGVELQAEQSFYVSIPKAALRTTNDDGIETQKATEFLLSASLIPQAGAPTSTALNGKVIFFEWFKDGVDMYESTDGAVVTNDLPARRLLAKFPIVSEKQDSLVINFDEGMKTLFIADWTAGGKTFQEGALDAALDALISRVFSVRHTPGRLTISQSVQGRIEFLGSVMTPRMEVRYYLTPYAATNYAPKLARESRHVRYFTNFPNLEKVTGKSRTNILRFDIAQPITFSYSANTPKEFEEAVRDGILYWNRAFGREVVKAEKAPEGLTAPHPDYNIVQWVPWDSAGFAYADVIADPRTGRSLHGQVYMTSVFAIKGMERARIALRQLQAIVEKASPEDPKARMLNRLGIRFLGDSAHWQPAGHCEQHAHEAAASMAQGITTLLSLENVTDQRILEMSQNYVREVIAHEIGHVLGLRHHFSANIQATLTAKEQSEWVKRALMEGKFETTPGKYPATSVMEYTEYFAAAYSGQKIKEGKEVLPYDQQAIQYGYFDKEEIIDNKTLFCSDEEVGTFQDCERFDPTGDTFLGTHTDIARAMDQLPGLFLEQFIAGIAPADTADKINVEEVNLKVSTDPIVTALQRSLRWFSSGTRFLSVENQFPFVGPLTEEEIVDSRWATLQKKVDTVGGTDRLFFAHLPLSLTLDTAAQPEGVVTTVKFSQDGFVAKVNQLLDGPTYSKFIGLDGKEYAFTEDQKKVIRARASAYAKHYEEALLKSSLSAFADAKLDLARDADGVTDSDTLMSKIEKQYVQIARELITATHPTKRIAGKVRSAQVSVEDFKYPLEVRLLASRLLSRSIGSQPYWADEARTSIRNAVTSHVEGKLLMKDIQNFKESDLSRTLRTWYAEQRQVMSSLPD